MSRKILFVDLDGTLLKNNKTVSAGNKQAIQQVLDAGHYVVLATGRAIASGRKIAKDLGLAKTGCYIMAYNGSVIYDCSADCILEEKRLPIEYAEYLVAEAQKAGIYVQTYSDSQVLAMKRSKELDFYTKRTGMSYRIEKDIWSLLNEEPPKILMIDLKGKKRLKKFQDDHREWEKGRCTSFFSCNEYLEYCPLGATKGYGVEYLEKFLDISEKNTISIGDQENDIPMLKAAYIGCAMQNADEKVKEIADYITEHDNEEDGVAEVINKFIL